MAPSAVIEDVEVNPDKQQTEAPPEDLKTKDRRQRAEALLRKIFEGHEEFLGWTPD